MSIKTCRPMLNIQVTADYQPSESDPEKACFAFRYHAVIQNLGHVPVTLVKRHWVITDAKGEEKTVVGPGDIATHPELAPGASFAYSSGVVIDSPVTAMHGYYEVIDDQGIRHQAEIPAFRLAKPGMVH